MNKFFRKPGVEGRESELAYSEWEYRWGKTLIGEYLEPRGDLAGRTVLDIGCGLGGKTIAYGEAGPKHIVGVDISEKHILASAAYVQREPRSFKWGFFASDASNLALPDGAFETVVANDAMEHFAEPEAAVREMARVTRIGGVIWFFFTPHFSPLGSHLYDYIYIPWCHLFFRRQQLEAGIRSVLKDREPDRSPAAIKDAVEKIMRSYDTDLNHMSVRRFFRILKRCPQLSVSFAELKPAKYSFLKTWTKIPLIRELITGTVVCRVERTG